jgi:hypothetical protein
MMPASLATLPASTQATLNLVDDLDQCFRVGFANLELSHQRTLSALQRIFNGTPLQSACQEAIAALGQYEFLESHFAVIASLRAALQGAVFDQLQHQVQSELGRLTPSATVKQLPPVAAIPQTDSPGHLQPLLESIRQWLMEVALVGFTRLDTATLTPFTATLEKLQAEPLLIRQSALLTGLFNELVSKRSTTDSNPLPLCRWVDLWTRAMIGTKFLLQSEPAQLVSGTLELLGIDVRQHANLVSPIAYGVLTVDGQPQFTCLTLSAYKVDAIQGDEIWLLFPQATTLLDAFAQTKTLRLNEVLMLPTGDLVLPDADLLLSGKGAVGLKYDLMKRAAEYFAVGASGVSQACWVHPYDRHPIQLAEPIFLKGYTVQSADALTLHWADTSIPIATERSGSLSAITVEAIANSSELFGLLRFDAGRWAVQPLAVTVGKKAIATGQNAAKVLKSPPKTSTVGILRERASRLLRQR